MQDTCLSSRRFAGPFFKSKNLHKPGYFQSSKGPIVVHQIFRCISSFLPSKRYFHLRCWSICNFKTLCLKIRYQVKYALPCRLFVYTHSADFKSTSRFAISSSKYLDLSGSALLKTLSGRASGGLEHSTCNDIIAKIARQNRRSPFIVNPSIRTVDESLPVPICGCGTSRRKKGQAKRSCRVQVHQRIKKCRNYRLAQVA